MSEKSNGVSTLDISGDLNLSSINFPKFSKNVTVSDELNVYLRGQLEHMKSENESLHQQLSKKHQELQKSQTKIEELVEKVKDFDVFSNTNEFTSATQLANSKIVELGKKLRDKTSESEVYKHKCLKLENSISELQKLIEAKEVNVTDSEKCMKEKDEADEIKRLQDKLAYTSNKWAEEKNSNTKLRNDLKKANKWLQQEVGEKFETLLTFNNSSSNWRGRAQIICDLQQKNQELKEKLKTLIQDRTVSNPETTSSTPVKFDKKVETLNRENLEIKANCDELKRKFEAVKARSKVLETECSLLKTRISSLNQNREADQQIIANLKVQVSSQKQQVNEDLKQQNQIIKKLHQENESLKIELVKANCLSENTAKELEEKNSDIELLNKRIRSSRPTSSYMHKPENNEAKIFNRLEVERLRLMELAEVQNQRLQDERNAHLKTQHLLRLERQKGARLEASLARLQLEQDSARSGYSCSKNSVLKETESDELKDKLELAEENIKALSTRLELEIFERKRDLQEFSRFLKDQ